jgi:hypothetical protein
MMLYLDPDRRSEPGRGAGPRVYGGPSHAPKLTFVAPLGLPPNDSHHSCTPWSVFQDGSVHATALMTGRARSVDGHQGRPGRTRLPPQTWTLGAGLPRSGGYKAAAVRQSHLPLVHMQATPSGSTGSGAPYGPAEADPGASLSWRSVNRFPYTNFTYF